MGMASAGDLVMVHSIILQLWNPLGFLGFYAREARQAMVDLESAQTLLEINSQLKELSEPLLLPPVSPAIPVVEFKGVSFGYQGEQPVLKDVSFAMKGGSQVAIVGRSGSGKSTVGRLIPRLYDVHGGGVFFNGVDVRRLSSTELRGRISFVSQDVVLFNESVRYNLEYAMPGCTEDAIHRALQASQLEEAVAAWPEGLDTVVGERGLRLSGGERQRLSLARALLREPELLILDEATSALDMEAEQRVLASIVQLPWKPTVFSVTHRLATAQQADQVLVLDGGSIAEQGTHEELLVRDGIYAAMCTRAVRTGEGIDG